MREVAHLEKNLQRLETDVESKLVERRQDEVFIRLLSRLDDKQKAEMSAATTVAGQATKAAYVGARVAHFTSTRRLCWGKAHIN